VRGCTPAGSHPWHKSQG